MHRTVLRPRPHEPASLETLRIKTQPVAVPPEDLDAIGAAAAEHEELPREWVLGELDLHECSKAVEPFSHVRRTAHEPYPCAGRQPDHRRPNALSTVASRSADTSPSTRTRAPHGSAISIVSDAVDSLIGDVTLTGSSCTARGGRVCSSTPCACWRRQLNKRLALTPCRRATSATETPGFSVSCTIRSFVSIVRIWRRGRVTAVGDAWFSRVYVSICSSRGHVHRVHLTERS